MDKKTYRLLKALYHKKHCACEYVNAVTGFEASEKKHNPHISFLLARGYITVWNHEQPVKSGEIPDVEFIGYSITLEGEAYIEQRRLSSRNFWVPYIITTAIAIASLLVALCALLRTDNAPPVDNPNRTYSCRSPALYDAP